jgi:hypothetical protein
MKNRPSSEFLTAFPSCPIKDVQETNLQLARYTGWLDVFKFDTWLTQEHKYNPDIESTLTFVTKIFGEKAAQILIQET